MHGLPTSTKYVLAVTHAQAIVHRQKHQTSLVVILWLLLLQSTSPGVPNPLIRHGSEQVKSGIPAMQEKIEPKARRG